jgi:hypothetical protein
VKNTKCLNRVFRCASAPRLTICLIVKAESG